LAGKDAELPGAVLFACSRNAVRSPMAEAILKHHAGDRIYVQSAGARAGEPDPFAIAVMAEIGIDIAKHRPTALADLHDTSFDLIVTLAAEAHHQALDLAGHFALEVEYWPTPDPTLASGSREQILSAYRAVRDGLIARIKARFPIPGVPAPGY
jgi:protein-tyrosine-phosphatase